MSPPTTAEAVGAPRLPLVVAHRAGNRLDALRASERAGVSVVEADVRLYRGRLEVRHLKRLRPLPLFWDRWEIATLRHGRLQLDELLTAASPATVLMLDLKGRRQRLANRLAEAITPYLATRRFLVSSRYWPLLERFAGLPVRRLHSVGTKRQLRELIRRSPDIRFDGVSVHERLLDAQAMADLHRDGAFVMTWPVNDAVRGAELLQLGVDGLISDRPDALVELAVAA